MALSETKDKRARSASPSKRDTPRLSRPETYSGPDAEQQAIRAAGSFFERVYAIVEHIPKGTVMTYGQIAMLRRVLADEVQRRQPAMPVRGAWNASLAH